MIFFNKDFNYPWLKENIGMIVLIPTFIGGLWQLMELVRLDTSYIRFFSLSQLASDGLLVMFVLLIYAIAVRLIYSVDKELMRRLILNTNKFRQESPEELSVKPFFYKEIEEDKGYKRFVLVYFFIVLGGFIFISYPFNFGNWTKLPGEGSIIKPINILPITGVIAVYFMIIVVLVRSILTLSDRRVNVHNKTFRRRLNKILSVFLPALCLYLLFKLPIMFHDAFLMPEDLKNKAYLLDRVKLENPKLKGCKIAYFNDRFIFISIVDSSSVEHVEVMQFDALFTVPQKD